MGLSVHVFVAQQLRVAFFIDINLFIRHDLKIRLC